MALGPHLWKEIKEIVHITKTNSTLVNTNVGFRNKETQPENKNQAYSTARSNMEPCVWQKTFFLPGVFLGDGERFFAHRFAFRSGNAPLYPNPLGLLLNRLLHRWFLHRASHFRRRFNFLSGHAFVVIC